MRSHSQFAPFTPDLVQAILARYVDIVDDPQSLFACSATPLPVCLWVNPIKSNPSVLLSNLTNLGISLESVPWMSGAFRTDDWRSPGQTLAFTAG
ncbi:MAG: hypothetical protein F6K42_04845, partial [Leptolyngbya sp. SIO1D8]|nr:hypothetical protein [Leptolyngbya sp. SIO1D8]